MRSLKNWHIHGLMQVQGAKSALHIKYDVATKDVSMPLHLILQRPRIPRTNKFTSNYNKWNRQNVSDVVGAHGGRDILSKIFAPVLAASSETGDNEGNDSKPANAAALSRSLGRSWKWSDRSPALMNWKLRLSSKSMSVMTRGAPKNRSSGDAHTAFTRGRSNGPIGHAPNKYTSYTM